MKRKSERLITYQKCPVSFVCLRKPGETGRDICKIYNIGRLPWCGLPMFMRSTSTGVINLQISFYGIQLVLNHNVF